MFQFVIFLNISFMLQTEHPDTLRDGSRNEYTSRQSSSLSALHQASIYFLLSFVINRLSRVTSGTSLSCQTASYLWCLWGSWQKPWTVKNYWDASAVTARWSGHHNRWTFHQELLSNFCFEVHGWFSSSFGCVVRLPASLFTAPLVYNSLDMLEMSLSGY